MATRQDRALIARCQASWNPTILALLAVGHARIALRRWCGRDLTLLTALGIVGLALGQSRRRCRTHAAASARDRSWCSPGTEIDVFALRASVPCAALLVHLDWSGLLAPPHRSLPGRAAM
ncbi:MAG: hypothetical protein ACLPVY_16575 [Acidimicrobiia bacterium]